MEGQFRIEVNYERIAADAESELSVPTLRVIGAEVEQGRVAVEALAAVEVQVARAEQLSSLDPSDLPQQLVLKTTNPILLAYKYVHTDPPYVLALRITRHSEVAVQSAAIDRATYQTLFTRDGLAVTTARFMVRNNRKQFLRIRLPEGAEVWSATVAGRPEKPAISSSSDDAGAGSEAPEILIKVINSIQGFPVELVYATPLDTMGSFGRVHAHLPQPDMIVTASRWDVYLPDNFRYGAARTNMEIVQVGELVSKLPLQADLSSHEQSRRLQDPTHPLRITVPSEGIHLGFEKLYANQSDQAAAFSVSYSSTSSARLGLFLAMLGGGLFWGGLAFAFVRRGVAWVGVAVSAVGVATALVSIAYLGTSPAPLAALSIVVVTSGLAYSATVQWRRRWIETEIQEPNATL
jgi:hypothetical protein